MPIFVINRSPQPDTPGAMPELSVEQRLWAGFMAGDETALNTLMTTHYRSLFRYGTRFSKDREFIKDAIQDLFLHLWERRTFLRKDVAIKPYLMASLRRAMHRNVPSGRPNLELGDEQEAFAFVFSVEEQFIQHETTFQRTQRMQQLLDTLPRRQKEVIYLKYFQELDRDHIAQVMDIAPQTVSNLLQLALRQLRQQGAAQLLMWLATALLATGTLATC
ncbi:RNA polymerase, sigma-24 subunit, ECF subfamily [Fibrella aestuarina BUZ 2]|uniref:RNA polymerase, sigma-24 subunit, ECF subfamily n=1 Tax=Fibrella aestuarina BUZ 2 TaxID=1166018 RepID=I0KDY5_9BACT|nr:sigma-70 family RNA polymerase sigma factor [Fibrella aestuarina]CCH02338.1 RNA polymerase, sigma-24 subunit, ECF subfamily [Fibrella aestuarina BUZ 2]